MSEQQTRSVAATPREARGAAPKTSYSSIIVRTQQKLNLYIQTVKKKQQKLLLLFYKYRINNKFRII
jgi:hypothetical protein